MDPVSANAKSYIRYVAVIPGIPLILFPVVLELAGETAAIILLCAVSALSVKHAESIQKKHSDEIDPKDVTIRLRGFSVMTKLLVIMLLVYVSVAALSKNIVTPIYSAGVFVLFLIFFVHEKVEIADLKSTKSGQPTASVRKIDP